MSHAEEAPMDVAPGDPSAGDEESGGSVLIYTAGLGLALFLTFLSFFIVHTTLVWGPSIPVALCVLAVAQMGVHLVFFIHITSGPDNTNNILALAFGVLIVILVVGGSLFIMTHMNRDMAMPADQNMPIGKIMQMQH